MPTSYIEKVVALIPPRRLFAILVLFTIYFITARFGLSINAVNGFATLIWPPTGIALAALLLYDIRLWPGIALGAFFVNFSIGAPILVAAGIATGNTLEAVAGVFLVRHFGFDNSFAQVKNVFVFIIGAALIAPAISASTGVISLLLGHTITSGVVETWSAWWVGDMLGALVFTPLSSYLALGEKADQGRSFVS